MFTGIIETKGKIVKASPINSGIEFQIQTEWDKPDLSVGDSVAINGACMTVTTFQEKGNIFSFYTSYKSLELTNLSKLHVGGSVNLERAMSAGQRFGGHMVQGHVDGVGKIHSRKTIESDSVEEFWVECPESLIRYLVKKGSITVDGVSLTIVEVENRLFQLILIPETLRKTNAMSWEVGKIVNLEVDVLAKYIENFMELRFSK
ncbi:riboflavin synthase [Leptospira ilyithenensis]|uniref:Riboflavin synthase n=1 Tax=Leptospira ilyithenensis TaxID=2484901 RepID=A0A4R9LSK6_9LEPT|nr:riboflavin synthase [Leptospira ilyithenensis]TGN11983.1 riboflavin synthase [Leptospira ilyithenensis]